MNDVPNGSRMARYEGLSAPIWPRRSVKNRGGRWLATRVAIVAGGVLAVLAVAVSFLVATHHGCTFESPAIGDLKTIGFAQSCYYVGYERYGTIRELVDAHCLDASWSDGVVRSGYRFRLEVCSGGAGFEAHAEPLENFEGKKYYYMDEEQVAFWSTSGPASRARTALGAWDDASLRRDAHDH